jgi:hypothetical protein
MTSAKRVGRTVGVLLLLQLVGIIIPFVLLHPLASSDYVRTVAGYSFQIKAAVLIFFVSCALTIGISITAWKVFRLYSEPMAMWLIVLSVICFMLQSVDNVHIMSMLSLSQQYGAGGASEEIFNALAAVVRSTRRWAHYPWLLGFDFWLATLFVILLRFGLIPRDRCDRTRCNYRPVYCCAARRISWLRDLNQLRHTDGIRHSDYRGMANNERFCGPSG